MWQYSINPLSAEAKKIVKRYSSIPDLPDAIFELSKKRILSKKLDTATLGSVEDTLSLHLIFLSAGLLFTPYSVEVRFVKEMVYKSTRKKLENIESELGATRLLRQLADKFNITEGIYDRETETLHLGEEVFDKKEIFAESQSPDKIRGGRGTVDMQKSRGVLDGIRDRKYGVPWKTFLPLLKHKEMRLTDWYIKGGLVLVSLLDLIELYSRLVAVEVFEYINKIYTRSKGVEIDERIKEIASALTEASKERFRAASFASGKAKELSFENFPPCISTVMNGVTSGSRNYGISVLLTSFLSYARIAPPRVDNPKISDFIKDEKILTEEIVPLIYQAAERCSPPLFDDQPQEKMNISYHLGLGLTKDIRLENSGASKWYFPSNCEKIRREAPGLCRPDDICRKIKNPLHYYFIKST